MPESVRNGEPRMRVAPNKVSLTLAVARDAPLPEKGDYTLWDSGLKGFGLRIYATGGKKWIAQKKLEGRPVRVLLGDFPDMPIAKARAAAETELSKIKLGQDPNLERRKTARNTEKERALEAHTIGVALDERIAAMVDEKGNPLEGVSPSTLRDFRNAKKRLAGGDLLKLPLEALDGKALEAEYRRLRKDMANHSNASQGGKTAAANVLRCLRGVCNRSRRNLGIDTPDPFKQLGDRIKGWQDTPRRTNTVAQAQGDLAKWWEAVERLAAKTGTNAANSATIADWLKVSLLLGGRRSETLSLKWEDIDFDRGFGCIPASNTKSRREHCFPLAPYLRSLLERRRAADRKAKSPSVWVFPSDKTGWKTKTRGHIVEPKKSIAWVVKECGIDFSAHDLRRTFGSLLNEMDVSVYTLKKALNHAHNDITGKHYVQSRMPAMLPVYVNYERKIFQEMGKPYPFDEEDAAAPEGVDKGEWEEFRRWKAQQAGDRIDA